MAIWQRFKFVILNWDDQPKLESIIQIVPILVHNKAELEVKIKIFLNYRLDSRLQHHTTSQYIRQSLLFNTRYRLQSQLELNFMIEGFLQRSNGRLPSAQGWSYLTGDQVWLYDSQIVVSWREPRNISHGAACPPRTGSDLPGYTLETLWTSRISSCVELCQARTSCLALTFISNICRLKYKVGETVPVKSNINIQSVTFNCSSLAAGEGGGHFEGLLASINCITACIQCLIVRQSFYFAGGSLHTRNSAINAHHSQRRIDENNWERNNLCLRNLSR